MPSISRTARCLIAILLFFPAAHAEWELAAEFRNETAGFTDSGPHHDAGDLYKSESQLKLFVNRALGDNLAAHAELNWMVDPLAVDGYRGHRGYSQQDYLRELYLDTTWGNTDFRIGKQQVAWGTADGMKLLDIINPTDWREFNQNKMEDSRIPVWMVNATTLLDDTRSVQFILSQAKPNRVPGLEADGDTGQPFISLGADSITGKSNGFIHLAPRLAGVATSFSMAAAEGMLGAVESGQVGAGLVPFSGLSVHGFAGRYWSPGADRALTPSGDPLPANSQDRVQNFVGFAGKGFVLLNAIAQHGLPTLMNQAGFESLGNQGETRVMSQFGEDWALDTPSDTTVGWDLQQPRSLFEYMPNAAFAQFNNSAGNLWLGQRLLASPEEGGMGLRASDLGYADNADFLARFHGPARAEYVRDYPADPAANFGLRFQQNLDSGLNVAVGYFYGYDANPVVDFRYRDAETGETLRHALRRPNSLDAPNAANAHAQEISPSEVSHYFDGTREVIANRHGQHYGAFNPMTGGLAALGDTSHAPNGYVVSLTERLVRVHNLGLSLDYAWDTDWLGPVVLRGEFLFKPGEPHPVVDRRLLAIGYLPGALTTERHDMFKYVLGVDITVLTNLMISTQFIQFRNLDYEHQARTCWTGTAPGQGQGQSFDCSRYTADAATLHLSNGLQPAERNQEFVSLFLSKPIGGEQQGRWNNLLIAEDRGGFWNRMELEYGFTDQLIGTLEWNRYWGERNSLFGQFDHADNVQIGVRYLF